MDIFGSREDKRELPFSHFINLAAISIATTVSSRLGKMNFAHRICANVLRLSKPSSLLSFSPIPILSRTLCTALRREPAKNAESMILASNTLQSIRLTTRGRDYVANNLRRMRRCGKHKYLKTRSGRIILIKRMMKGVNPRVLTH